MGSATKLKACYSCTSGKRKCDKAQPICSRCDDKDIDCRYPPVRRKRTQQARDTQIESTVSSVLTGTGQPGQVTRLDMVEVPPSTGQLVDLDQWTRHLIHWDQDPDEEPRGRNPTTLASFQLPAPDDIDSLRTASTVFPDALLPSPSTTFFLKPSSWIVSHLRVETPVFSSTVCMNYVRGVHAWFTEWVNTGHSPFIHRQLYADTGLPQCMRDAFSSITVHNTKTPANEAIVNDILETNASTLLNTYPSDTNRLLDTRHHLARTQALFIHVVLSLFSPSLHARSTAERYITTLLRWTQQLWDAASIDPDLQDLGAATDDITAASAAAADALFDGDPHPRLWRAWVLSESIRRVWLLATTTIGVYLTLTQRWAQCQGGVSFTARRSLWAAESAVAWADACNSGDPLFICSLEDEMLFRQVRACEVDEVARNMFTIMWGAERVESWIARTAGREGKVKLWF